MAESSISQTWHFDDESVYPDTLYDAEGLGMRKTARHITYAGPHSCMYEYKEGEQAYAVKFFDRSEVGTQMWRRELDLIAKARDVQTLFVPLAVIESHQALVMPVMDGTLEDLSGTLDERSIIHMSYALLVALNSIYVRTGLYYIDVHPGNVLCWNLEEGVSFWLTDIGALYGSEGSSESKMVFSWMCTVMLIAGVKPALVESVAASKPAATEPTAAFPTESSALAQSSRQNSRNSDVQTITSDLSTRMPKLLRALSDAGMEMIDTDDADWARNLNIPTCLAAFRTTFFVRTTEVIELETVKESALELRLSFARSERDQIQAAMERELSPERSAAERSEDMARYRRLLEQTEERIAQMASRLEDERQERHE